jgi:guanine nucleotide-binding protein subunit alpha
MRLLYKPYSHAEIESYRQLVFDNLIHGMNALLDALDLMDFTVSSTNIPYIEMVRDAGNVRDGEPFPYALYEALRSLWKDPSVKAVWKRRNEAALPEKFVMFQTSLIVSHS